MVGIIGSGSIPRRRWLRGDSPPAFIGMEANVTILHNDSSLPVKPQLGIEISNNTTDAETLKQPGVIKPGVHSSASHPNAPAPPVTPARQLQLAKRAVAERLTRRR